MPIKKETGKERQFDTGAKKQAAAGKGTPVLIPGDAMIDIAKHFEDGATHYSPRNWEKGIPLSELLNSAERHLQQLKMGMTDESHDRAFVWNAIVYLATKLRIAAGILPKELDDMPRYNQTKEYDFTGYEITNMNTIFGWYVCNINDEYLHSDLTFHSTTGSCINAANDPGYYKTKKLAEETLQAYLDKEKDVQYPNLCDECMEKVKTVLQGETVELCKECSKLLLKGGD